MSILDLGDRLASAITGVDIPYDIVIRRHEQDPDSPPFDPDFIDVDYDCTGWVDSYDAALIANSIVGTTDRKVFVLQSSLDITPTTTDHVIIDDVAKVIVSVSADPAGACWVLQVTT